MEDKAFQWKMIFKPDPSKQKHEVFSVETHKKKSHLKLFFNNTDVAKRKKILKNILEWY